HIPAPRNKPDTRPRFLFLDESPPLLIRLKVDHYRLPAGYTFELPREESLRLIRRGLACAVAVGDFRAVPDLTLTPEDMEAATA
ncbi:MAG: hypothetical protein WBD93_19970, partial [Acidobacteriaceae bacterium]